MTPDENRSVTQRVSDALGVFSPAQGLMTSPSTRWNRQTEVLLRGRLGALIVLVVIGGSAFAIRRLFVDAPISWAQTLGPQVVFIAVTVLLFSPLHLGLWPLRTLEVALFWGLTADLMWIDWIQAREALAHGLLDVAVGQLVIGVLHAVLLIVAYALFVPNSWQRAALIIAPMAVAPLATAMAFRRAHPEVARAAALDPELGLQQGSIAVLTLAMAVAVAVYGVRTISRYRVAAAEAGEMGQYFLERQIGQGGMGEVWLARHRMLARPAAIKLIRPEMVEGGSEAPESIVARFEREAQATARLGSPHTVDLYDFGITDDGTFFAVMEYLDGLDLDTLVGRFGPLPPERVVHLLLQACESLAEAHAAGLIHRDIKPANVFACRLGLARDFVKVLDFGLVKHTQRGASDVDVTRLTREGIPAGTPAFMAPEMVVGDGEVDGRADLYSLGCVAYWLLTAGLVFESGSAVGMLVDHVRAEPEPVSRRTELEIPTELDELVLRCLRKDPGERFASAQDLADALARVPLAGTWDARRARQWWDLHLP